MSRVAVFVLALGAGVVAVIGAVGRWVNGPGGTPHYNGIDANAGKSVLAASIVAVALLAVATWQRWRWAAIVAAIPAAIAGAIAGYYCASPSKFVTGGGSFSAAWGLYLATIGSIALFALCLIHALLPVARAAPAAAPPPPETPA